MNNKQLTGRVIKALKEVNEADYLCMAAAFGGEKTCEDYIYSSLRKCPDTIIELLDGNRSKTNDGEIIEEIDFLISCIR